VAGQLVEGDGHCPGRLTGSPTPGFWRFEQLLANPGRKPGEVTDGRFGVCEKLHRKTSEADALAVSQGFEVRPRLKGFHDTPSDITRRRLEDSPPRTS